MPDPQNTSKMSIFSSKSRFSGSISSKNSEKQCFSSKIVFFDDFQRLGTISSKKTFFEGQKRYPDPLEIA